MEWNHRLIDEIRETKQREKSADRDGALGWLPYLPGAEVHYAYELLQNADDEGASEVEFLFTQEALIFWNNGKPFGKDDVLSVCSLGVSRKRRKIGFFGVGFKSVFEVAEVPQVISGEFNFEIRDYIFPFPRNDVPRGAEHERGRGACIILRYGKKTREELSETLLGLNARLLLFLNNVKEVRVTGGSKGSTSWHVRKSVQPDGRTVIEDGRRLGPETWFVVKRKLFPPPDVQPRQKVQETEIAVAFAPGKEQETRHEPVYCYLPTRKQAGVPFLLQADFTPTLGRENLKEDTWDTWLFAQLGRLAADAIATLKESVEVAPFLYDCIPLESDSSLTDRQVLVAVRAMHTRLKQREFVRGANGEWLKPPEAILSPPQLQYLFSPSEVLRGGARKLQYADPSLPDRAELVLTCLGAMLFDIGELVAALKTPNILKGRSPPDLLRIYDFIAGRLSTNPSTAEGLVRQLGSNPFLLTYEGAFVAPATTGGVGRLVAYPGKTTKAELATLPGKDLLVVLNPFLELSSVKRRKKDDGLEKERVRVKEFLANRFGIQRSLTVSQIILNLIVPKLSSQAFPERKADSLLDYMRLNLGSFVKEARASDRSKREEKTLHDLGRKVFVSGVTLDGMMERRPAVTTYLPGDAGGEPSMEALFRGVSGVWFVAPRYFRKRTQRGELSWAEFFHKLGSWGCPRVEHRPGPFELSAGDYPWVDREYSPKGIHEISDDYVSPDVQQLLTVCSALPFEEAVKRYSILWEALDRNWSAIYHESTSCSYEWSWYGRRGPKSVDSSFIHLLQSAKWVLGSDGQLHDPGRLSENTEENREILGKSAVLAVWSAAPGLLKALGVRRRPTIETAMRRLHSLKDSTSSAVDLIGLVLPVYRFLQKGLKEQNAPTEELRERFEKAALVYLPREDRTWWEPSSCFWSDFAHVFKATRGYLEPKYPLDLAEFFGSVGVRQKPDFAACLKLIEELRARDERDAKQVLPDLYKYMSKVLSFEKPGVSGAPTQLLDVNGRWIIAKSLFFADDARLRAIFPSLPYVYAPVAAQTIASLFELLEVSPLSACVTIRKTIQEAQPLSPDLTARLRSICAAVVVDLQRRTEPGPHFARWVELSKNLEIYTVASIKVRSSLRHGKLRLQHTETPSCFYSTDENRLYLQDDGETWSVACATELGRLFGTHADDARPTLSALMPAGRTEEGLVDMLDQLGLGGPAPDAPSTPVQYLPAGTAGERTSKQTGSTATSPAPSQEAPQATADTPTPLPNLKDPRRLKVGTLRMRSPYKAEEGPPEKEAELVRKPPGGGPKPAVVHHSVGPTKQAVQRTGHDVVEMVEKRAGRNPISHAGQTKVGYDYESSGRKIEVKDFQMEDPPVFGLDDYEMKVAKEEGDSYWVYIVAGLREGASTVVYAIQNPLKYLKSKPPPLEEFEDWKPAVREEYPIEEKGDRVDDKKEGEDAGASEDKR